MNSLSALVTRGINLTLVIWVSQYLLRRISVEEYSLYPVVLAVMTFFPLLSTVLTSGLGRFAVDAYARGDRQGVTRIVSTMLPLHGLVSLGVILLGMLLIWRVEDVLVIPAGRTGDARLMLGLLVVMAALRLLLAPFGIGLFMKQRFVWLNGIQLIGAALRLTVLLTLLLGVSTRVVWVVVANVAGDALALLLQVILSRRLVPELRLHPRLFSWSTARELTSFGAWSFVTQVAGLLRQSMDPLILNRFGTPMDVTCFSVGGMVLEQLRHTTRTALNPLVPPLTAMHSRGEDGALGRAYLRGGRYGLWAISLAAVPLIVFRRELVTLYIGEDYLPSATVVGLLLSTLLFQYGNLLLPGVAAARARLRPVALGVLGTQLANLALTLVLVGAFRMGAYGSALATFAVGLVAPPLWMWTWGCRLADVPLGRWIRETLLPGLVPVLAGGAAWLALHRLARPDSWSGLAGCFLVGALAHASAVLLMAWRSEDRTELQRILRRLRGS